MNTFIFIFSCAMALFLIAGAINLIRLGKITWPESQMDDPNPPAIDRTANPLRFWAVIMLGLAVATAFAITAYFESASIF